MSKKNEIDRAKSKEYIEMEYALTEFIRYVRDFGKLQPNGHKYFTFDDLTKSARNFLNQFE